MEYFHTRLARANYLIYFKLFQISVDKQSAILHSLIQFHNVTSRCKISRLLIAYRNCAKIITVNIELLQ